MRNGAFPLFLIFVFMRRACKGIADSGELDGEYFQSIEVKPMMLGQIAATARLGNLIEEKNF